MRGIFHSRVDTPAQENADTEALAYSSLEEARLRVERLWPCLPRGSRVKTEPELRLCHRHLGLAGFHSCAELGSGTRREWLALAHDRLRGDERDPVKATLDAIVRATDAVEHALIATDLADNIQTAHGHILAACESFGVYLRRQAWE